MSDFKNTVLELIKKTSSELPKDVIKALNGFTKNEKKGAPAKYAMDIIDENIELARKKEQPLCQDTGSILFFVKASRDFDQIKFISDAKSAVVTATEKGYLRQNSVDSLTGKNSGNNLGPGSPTFHFEQTSDKNTDIRLILKGGGCENVGIQYSLPYAPLGAERSIDGAKKCIIDSALKAQGKGCAPGVLGVTIGGDRGNSYIHSKEQFLRKLDDKSTNETLARLEKEVVTEVNKLGIGPMGFGGKTTIFGCKIGMLNRLPASYFVTVSYMCWAFRRQGIFTDNNGHIINWIY